MHKAGRCADREGVGGFLESILAVMVVITACSVFMVVLASGAIEVEEIDRREVVGWLRTNGLLSEGRAMRLNGSSLNLSSSALPEGISGMNVTYRLSGDPTPLLSLERGMTPHGDVLAFQLPQLIEMNGRSVPGVLEVRAWR